MVPNGLSRPNYAASCQNSIWFSIHVHTYNTLDNIPEIQFGSHVHMLSISKKYISKCQNIMTKSSAHKSWLFMSEHKVSRKNDSFFVLHEKDKNMSREKAYFSTETCLFYTDRIKSRFPVNRLLKHVRREDVCADIFYRIF